MTTIHSSGWGQIKPSRWSQVRLTNSPRGGIATLTDEALKAVCDRNGWLYGTADERTSREIVERHLPRGHPHSADGDVATLTANAIGRTPDDAALDQATWRDHPPPVEPAQTRQLLDLAAREALHRFAGFEITPRTSRAEALAGRNPDRLARISLRASADDLAPAVAERVGFHSTQQGELDLGL